MLFIFADLKKLNKYIDQILSKFKYVIFLLIIRSKMARKKNLEIKKKVYAATETLPMSARDFKKRVDHSLDAIYRYLLILVSENKIAKIERSGITMFYLTPKMMKKRNLHK